MKLLKYALIVFIAVGCCVRLSTRLQKPKWSVACPEAWPLGFSSDDRFVILAETDDDKYLVHVHFYSAADGTIDHTTDFSLVEERISSSV